MPTSPIPHVAAPSKPTDYRKYFHKLSAEVILLAWKARARVRIWNYWRTGDPSGTWTFFLPYVSLTRDGAPSPSFRYRLCFAALCWGFDIGLIKPKRVLIHDGKNFTRLADTRTGRTEVVNCAPLTEEYHPDEANERP